MCFMFILARYGFHFLLPCRLVCLSRFVRCCSGEKKTLQSLDCHSAFICASIFLSTIALCFWFIYMHESFRYDIRFSPSGHTPTIGEREREREREFGPQNKLYLLRVIIMSTTSILESDSSDIDVNTSVHQYANGKAQCERRGKRRGERERERARTRSKKIQCKRKTLKISYY